MTDEIQFVDEQQQQPHRPPSGRWKILIVDDEAAVHQVTELALRRVEFEGRRLEFLNAYSGQEARQILGEHEDIAVVLLDIIMETVNAGLEVAEYIRRTLHNFTTRIILRTGQPGDIPEREVILNYEIDGYKTKTELTAQRLFSEIMTSLRSYRDMRLVQRHNAGLETLVAAMTKIHEPRDVDSFVAGVLEQQARLLRFATADGAPGACWAAEYSDGGLRLLGGAPSVPLQPGDELASSLPAALVARVRDANWHKRCHYEDGTLILVGRRCREPALTLCFHDVLPLGSADRHLLEILSSSVETAYENLRLDLENAQHRLHLEQRVEARTAELVEARERLYHAERMASLGQMAAGVAHEINNPLAFINSNLAMVEESLGTLLQLAEALRRHLDGDGADVGEIRALCEACEFEYLREEVPEVLSESRQGVARISEIVRALREFSDLDACQPAPVDLNELVSHLVTNVPAAVKRGVQVRCELGELPLLEAVPEQLNQALGNILRNALEASPADGSVVVTTQCREHTATVTVSDAGRGIEAGEIKRIFDPFYTTKAVGQGTGLGLALAYGVVRQHGGEIAVESAPGAGTQVRVCLPLARCGQST